MYAPHSQPDARPVIAILPWRRHLPTFLGERTELDTLHPPYSDGIAEAGGFPIIAPRPPAGGADAAIGDLFALADGIVLSGGGDVDPETYGERADGALLVDLAADLWEIRVVREAAARRVPLLGICRGAQIMAVAFGGRLVQQLPPDCEHGDLLELEPGEVLSHRHWVDLLPGSLLHEVFETVRVHVNTIHHHAVVDPGPFVVSGVAAGGLIEGIEAGGALSGWQALGVQWHPEKMEDDPHQRRLFVHFVEAATNHRLVRLGARQQGGARHA